MYENKKIGVVVPAHNEERFVAIVIDTMPGFVDKIYVVDDASTDRTSEIASKKIDRNNGRWRW
jgi:glycosyltransferase involved in cell wall biosynthesis